MGGAELPTLLTFAVESTATADELDRRMRDGADPFRGMTWVGRERGIDGVWNLMS